MNIYCKSLLLGLAAPLCAFWIAPSDAAGSPAISAQSMLAASVAGVTAVAGSVYVPINPCRIVDTRPLFGGNGVPLPAGTTKAYDAVASSFATQGGDGSDCGVPVGTTAIAASVYMLSATSSGDLRAWATDGIKPNSAIGVFNPSTADAPLSGQTIFNGTFAIIPLCATNCTNGKEFQVFVESGQIDLVIDVNGYFLPATLPVNGLGQGLTWGTIARNTIGNATAQLRNDASAPMGSGSLQLTVGSGTDKIEFGDEISFVGNPVSGLTQIGYVVKTTGENIGLTAGPNMPSIAIEVFANTTGPNTGYTTMNYSPSSNSAANTWSPYIDAVADTSNSWGLTGSTYNSPAATSANCGINGPRCTFAQVQALLPNATIISVAVGKGRDFGWNGQIDSLRINGTTYDFEFGGVRSIATP